MYVYYHYLATKNAVARDNLLLYTEVQRDLIK